MSSHHFLSYSSVDAGDFPIRLADALEAGPPSIPVWLFQRDLKVGQDWDAQLAEAVKTCETLLFIMTPDSVRDNSVCKQEWSWALKYKKPIVPILLHPDAELPFRLGSRQYINCTGPFDRCVAQLRNHVRWLASPEGALQAMKDRLEDAQRELSRTIDPTQKERVQADIDLLEKQIAEQQRVVEDPEGAAKRVKESIARGLERERQPEKPIKGVTSTKFINPPPGVAPAYFQDRQIESKMIGDFLKNDALHLLTVTGRAGTGKTALVSRVLKSLEGGQLPDNGGPMTVDGIVYLSAIGTRRINLPNIFADLSKLLPSETANQVDTLYKNPQASTEAKVRALIEALPGERTVLLLDNFEDMLDPEHNISDRELDEALKALLSVPYHGLKVIITTRVAPSALTLLQPARQTRLDLDEGLSSPYAENILREMDADGKVGLKSAPDELLAEARERTRGNPRALEALFAILSADRSTSLEDIVKDTARLLPENVVQALVGEAFNRLDAGAQRVMQALAVYARPVTPTAVDYLLHQHVPGVDSAHILALLVNVQLAYKEAGRYYLHPVDREYALARIPKGQKVDRYGWGMSKFTQIGLLYRAANYFKQVRKPREEWKTIEDLTPQLAEFDLRYAGEDYDTAAMVLIDICDNYLYLWGHYRILVEMFEQLEGKLDDPWLKQSIVGALGHVYIHMGRYQKAIGCYELAFDIARKTKNRQSEGVWLCNLGNCYAQLGQFTRAIDYYEQALSIDREIGHRRGEAFDLGNLGACYSALGQTARAIDYHEQALLIRRQTGDRYGETVDLANLANSLNDQGRYARAIEYALECVRICEEIGTPSSHGYAKLARAHFGTGDLDKARAAAEAALQFDEPLVKHTIFGLLGIIAFRQGDHMAAQEAFAAAEAQANTLLDYEPQNYDALDTRGFALCGLTLCEGKSHVPAAIEAYRASRTINRDAGNVRRSLSNFDALALGDTEGLLAEVRTVVAGE